MNSYKNLKYVIKDNHASDDLDRMHTELVHPPRAGQAKLLREGGSQALGLSVGKSFLVTLAEIFFVSFVASQRTARFCPLEPHPSPLPVYTKFFMCSYGDSI